MASTRPTTGSPSGPGRATSSITADIPLADRSLKAGASVVGNTGVPFTTASIGMAMASRELMSNLRAMGEITGGPKPMSPARPLALPVGARRDDPETAASNVLTYLSSQTSSKRKPL